MAGPSAAEDALRTTLERTQRQLLAVSRAGQLEALAAGDVDGAVQQITELAARATGCARVNAWLFNDDETELYCIDLYEADVARHSAGLVLREPDFRPEFEFLKTSRYVDADDPLTDPRTAGYVQPYLTPLGITSMLDVVVRVSGRNLGLLCFEHVNQPHHWQGDEVAFACQLADKIGLVLATRTRMESERRLRDSEAALAEAQAIAHLGSWEYDIPRDTLTWSDETFRIFGLTRETFAPTYSAFFSRLHADDRAQVEAAFRTSLSSETDYVVDHRIILDDGTVRHVTEHGRTTRDADGHPVRSVGTVQDITDRKRAEQQLQLANTIFATQMETSPDGILVVDADARILSSNQRFADMWNLPADLLSSGDDGPVLAAVLSQVKDPAAFRTRVEHLYATHGESGHEEIETTDARIIERHTSPLRAQSGTYLGRVWFFRDITDRRRAEARMRHTARHDGLTGLANRLVFKEAVEQAVARARRGARGFAILCLDLDHFKDINDTLGHPAGDQLLQQVAVRLRAACRVTDTVARFGGDEFAVIVSDVGEPADVAKVAASLIDAVTRPFEIEAGEVRTGASIGITLYSPEEPDAEVLLSQADLALYRAKSDGRGVYEFFTPAMALEVRTRVTLGTQLRDAIATNQLLLHYQPQVHIYTGQIVGVEALVRWRHPDRGLMEPSVFIPIAEQNGLIGALTVWVLRESCRQAKAWRDAGLRVETIAVNLSALQFRTPQILERDVLAVVEASGLPTGVVELELTETALMAASREQSDILTRLRATA